MKSHFCTAQHSAAWSCAAFTASEATQEAESSFRYFCCSWWKLLANFLLRPEFPHDKSISEHLQIDRFSYIDTYRQYKLSIPPKQAQVAQKIIGVVFFLT